MAKNILFNDEARKAIRVGIDKLASAVKMTLGPRGRAVVIEKSYGSPQVTFDGVTVAKEIELEDKFENLGAEFIKQAADKTNDNVGDGTTTSVVLSHALIDEGEKAIRATGFNVIQLAEELKKIGIAVATKLEEQREVVSDNRKVQEVATLSAKDGKIGKLIAAVMSQVGKEGVVTIEDSNTIENSFDVVEGMQLERGYISQYMITDPARMEAILESPYILVTDKKISSIKDILPLLEKIAESGKKELVIVAEDIEGEALATLVVNKLRGSFTVLGIKAPGFGDRKKEMLDDIAVVTGATFITEDLGKNFENTELTDLGHAKKVIATKDTTTIVDGRGKKESIKERVAQLKTRIAATDSSFDKEKLQERVGKLSGGVAVLKVGAPTESAQKELKQRVEDAVAATRAAMEEGIVPGGGIALYNATKTIRIEGSEVEKAAQKILINALQAPIRAIITNSGESPDSILKKLETENAGNNWIGFNASTNTFGNLKELGIIDPLKVTKTALQNAISVASNYLMVGAAITEIPKKDEPMGSPGMGGMGGMM